jgi:hypothetical protein
MQMYQQQMQVRPRAQENYMNRQRVVMGLQQELQGLMMRLNQAQMGLYSGGYLGFDSNIGGSYYGGTQPIGYSPGYGPQPPYGGQMPYPSGGGYPQPSYYPTPTTVPPAGSIR